jgi:hypothetical protein
MCKYSIIQITSKNRRKPILRLVLFTLLPASCIDFGRVDAFLVVGQVPVVSMVRTPSSAWDFSNFARQEWRSLDYEQLPTLHVASNESKNDFNVTTTKERAAKMDNFVTNEDERKRDKVDTRIKRQAIDRVWIADRSLWTADVLGMAVACQLLGLVDAVTAQDFVTNGGWFQPITVQSSTTTLPTLVQRFSVNTVVWTMAATVLPLLPTAASGTRPEYYGEMMLQDSLWNTRKIFVLVLVVFVLLRVTLDVGVVAFLMVTGTAHDLPNELQLRMLETLRECYFVGLAMATTRSAMHELYSTRR